MERVAFLIEATGQRIGCLLNPEGLVVRRSAGVRPAASLNGLTTGAGLSDDPLLYTGGGRTELQLDLLFDVTLAGSSMQTTDVRDLTAPLWRLAENAHTTDGYGAPPLARFVWGKAWNILGVVTAAAERFEHFTAAGEPQRSWLRLRFVRVPSPAEPPTPETDLTTADGALEAILAELPDEAPTAAEAAAAVSQGEMGAAHVITGEGPDGESLPEIAYHIYGDPALWRLLAWFNDVTHPLQMAAGELLQAPPLSLWGRWP